MYYDNQNEVSSDVSKYVDMVTSNSRPAANDPVSHFLRDLSNPKPGAKGNNIMDLFDKKIMQVKPQ